MTTTDILKARAADKPGVHGATIKTASGILFDFIEPKPWMFNLDDIAWSLSLQTRFNGHCSSFYSIAQHSCLVSRLCPPEHSMAGLLHDGGEFVVGDMVGPLKQLVPDFKVIELNVEEVLFATFGIPFPLDPCVKHADLRALRTEQRDLTRGRDIGWKGLDIEADETRIATGLPPLAAYDAFMRRFAFLKAGARGWVEMMYAPTHMSVDLRYGDDEWSAGCYWGLYDNGWSQGGAYGWINGFEGKTPTAWRPC